MKEAGTKRCRFSGICYDKGSFWLSPRDNGPVVKWNEDENIWQEYSDFPKDYVAASTIGIMAWNDEIMIFPQTANMILAINRTDGTMKEWDEKYRGQNILWFERSGKSRMAFMTGTADMIVVNEKRVKKIHLFFPELFLKQYRKKMSATYRKLRNGMEKDDILRETYSDALRDYCRYVPHHEEAGEEISPKEEIGRRLYCTYLLNGWKGTGSL